MTQVYRFLQEFKDWASKQENILGAVLVGSYARDAAKETSDIDLVIITKNPSFYLDDNSWMEQLGEIKRDGIKDEDWGLVKTKRVFYENGIEAEFNIATEEWAKTNPVDKGTKKVMTDGNKILVDKEGMLKKLINAIDVWQGRSDSN